MKHSEIMKRKVTGFLINTDITDIVRVFTDAFKCGAMEDIQRAFKLAQDNYLEARAQVDFE